VDTFRSGHGCNRSKALCARLVAVLTSPTCWPTTKTGINRKGQLMFAGEVHVLLLGIDKAQRCHNSNLALTSRRTPLPRSGRAVNTQRRAPPRDAASKLQLQMETSNTSSKHVCFLVHGLQGAPGDLTYLAHALQQRGLLVHTVQCNWRRTTDGISSGGKRVAAEIEHVVADYRSRLQWISLVGFSLGGLYVRSALETLFDDTEGTTKVAGLEPHTLICIATPHLGVSSYGLLRYCPRWSHFLAGVFAGQTGRELFLLDEEQEPLLLRMAQHRAALRAMAAFSVRLLVANLSYDLMVNAGTSLVLPYERRYRVPVTTYEATCIHQAPHVRIWQLRPEAISASSRPETLQLKPDVAGASVLVSPFSSGARVLYLLRSFVYFCGAWLVILCTWDQKTKKKKKNVQHSGGSDREDIERRMASALNQVSWDRYAVEFDAPWIPAHNRIVAWSRNDFGAWLWRHGRPVVDHIATHVENCPSAQLVDADVDRSGTSNSPIDAEPQVS
jgi:hypothetical protein